MNMNKNNKSTGKDAREAKRHKENTARLDQTANSILATILNVARSDSRNDKEAVQVGYRILNEMIWKLTANYSSLARNLAEGSVRRPEAQPNNSTSRKASNLQHFSGVEIQLKTEQEFNTIRQYYLSDPKAHVRLSFKPKSLRVKFDIEHSQPEENLTMYR